MKMCQSFTRLGHQVELHTPHSRSSEKDVETFSYYGISHKFNVKKHSAPFYPSLLGRSVYAWGCGKSLWQAHPHLVYGRDWPALLMAANLGLPVILELHAPAPQNGIKRVLFDRLASNNKLVRLVVNSEALQSNVAEYFPQVRARLLLARNGADPAPPDDGQQLPIVRPGKRMIVGYTGHLYPGKGMEILGDLAHLCPWADFHVVGGWPEDIAFWKNCFERETNIFFHGHVPPSEVPRFIRAFDVLLAPYQSVVTLHGGVGDNAQWVCPLKVFDYMAAGKPIICSDHPVLREILSHGRDALLCAPTDVTGWATFSAPIKGPQGVGVDSRGWRVREIHPML